MLARLQGLYFVGTGVWPLLSMRTFEAVTGPKVDRWLVKTVGVLVSVIGLSLLRAGRRPSAATTTLAAGSAAGLGAIDVIYAARGRISRVYLLDAVLELLLLVGWARGWAQRPQAPGVRPSERSMAGAARRSRSR
jgi:hypothetical protein